MTCDNTTCWLWPAPHTSRPSLHTRLRSLTLLLRPCALRQHARSKHTRSGPRCHCSCSRTLFGHRGRSSGRTRSGVPALAVRDLPALAVSLTPAPSVAVCAPAPAATAVGFACSLAAAARGRRCQCGHSRTHSGCTRSTHSRTLRGPADDAAAVVLESARPHALQPCALRPCALWPYALRTCFGRARSAR